jgi:hypothetical protein
MKVVFYDKRNKREVSNDELMPINYVRQVVVVQEERDIKKGGPFYCEDVIMGDIGYKVDKNNDNINWDHWLMTTDLVFLRLEE